MTDSTSQDQFARVWPQVDPIDGWLTREQAWVLWREASRLPHAATVVEIGSHQGRSTVVLGKALAARGGAVVAIDPFVEGRLFGGSGTREVFEHNIRQADLTSVVRLLPARSGDVRPTYRDAVDLLYIDGKHDYWTVSDDLHWVTLCRPGTTVLIHDAFSSVGVTTALLRESFGPRRLRYVGRSGSLAHFVVGRPTSRDRRRMWREVPWWLRNVTVKLTLRMKARPLARALGHHGDADPY